MRRFVNYEMVRQLCCTYIKKHYPSTGLEGNRETTKILRRGSSGRNSDVSWGTTFTGLRSYLSWTEVWWELREKNTSADTLGKVT